MARRGRLLALVVEGVRMLSICNVWRRGRRSRHRAETWFTNLTPRARCCIDAAPEGPRPAVPRRGRDGKAPGLGGRHVGEPHQGGPDTKVIRLHAKPPGGAPRARRERGELERGGEVQRMVIARALLAGAVTRL